MIEQIYVMMYRQVKRFMRARSRIIGIFLNNILWLVLFGLGMASALNPVSRFILKGLDYLAFLLPAMYAISIFQASFMGGISVIWDKQFGFLKEVLIAPVSRSLTILGRALGDALTSTFNAIVMLAIGFILTDKLDLASLPYIVITGLIMGLGFTSLGIAIASAIKSPEGFQLIVGAITMPMTILSGAMFPLNMAPEWMRIIALVSPLTYAVDLCRYHLTGVSILRDVHPCLTPTIETTVLVIASTAFVIVAAEIFNKATLE